jgi:hypothetical protein
MWLRWCFTVVLLITSFADDMVVLADACATGVRSRSAAMASRLLMDSASRLYRDGAAFSLQHAVRSARLGLDPVGAEHPTVATVA